MTVNKWKIFGKTVITWLIFSFLAKLILNYQIQYVDNLSMIDTQATVWSWMSVFMGIFMAIKIKRWLEFLIGIVAFILCLFPLVGIFIGMFYFSWCYFKLEKISMSNSARNV